MRMLVAKSAVLISCAIMSCAATEQGERNPNGSENERDGGLPVSEPPGGTRIVPGEMPDTAMRVDMRSGKRLSVLPTLGSIVLFPYRTEVSRDYLLALVRNDSILGSRAIKGAWIDNAETEFPREMRFLKPPLIEVRNVDSTPLPEVLFWDRQHIGTWNAASVHIYRFVGTNIDYVGSFEYLLHLPETREFVLRSWSPGLSKVEVRLIRSPDQTTGPLIGTFEVKLGDSIFIQKPQVELKRLADLLTPMPASLYQEEAEYAD